MTAAAPHASEVLDQLCSGQTRMGGSRKSRHARRSTVVERQQMSTRSTAELLQDMRITSGRGPSHSAGRPHSTKTLYSSSANRHTLTTGSTTRTRRPLSLAQPTYLLPVSEHRLCGLTGFLCPFGPSRLLNTGPRSTGSDAEPIAAAACHRESIAMMYRVVLDARR